MAPVPAVSTYVLEKLPRQAAGRVHSVFAHSFNIEAEGFLLHVGTCRSPLSCYGARIPEREMNELLLRIRVGDGVVIQEGRLRIYDWEGVSVLDVGALEPRDLFLGDPVASSDLALLQGLFGHLCLPERVGLPLDNRLCSCLHVLCARESSKTELSTPISWLLGRGPGLTPSGDDILVGVGIGLTLRGDARCFVETLRQILRYQTTDISRAYLVAMMSGYANEGYCALAQSLRQGEREKLEGTLRSLQRFGHTSGSDGLLGFAASCGTCPVHTTS